MRSDWESLGSDVIRLYFVHNLFLRMEKGLNGVTPGEFPGELLGDMAALGEVKLLCVCTLNC